MTKLPGTGWRVVSLAVLLLAALARAQEVGTVASLDGHGEVGRAGAWTDAAIGSAIHQGDELRTGRPGRMRIVFQDDSVISLGENSHLIIDEHVFDPSRGKVRSFLQLVRGKVETLVSEYYNQPGATSEVKTKTAVSGVRGTEYIMTYDEHSETTEIIGVSGHVAVHGSRDLVGHEVLITAREITTVTRGGFPSPPRRLEDAEFRQYLEGLEFTGGGRAESLTVGDPVIAGASVPSSERAQALPPPPVALPIRPLGPAASQDTRTQARDAASLLLQPPAAVEAASGKLRIRLF